VFAVRICVRPSAGRFFLCASFSGFVRGAQGVCGEGGGGGGGGWGGLIEAGGASRHSARVPLWDYADLLRAWEMLFLFLVGHGCVPVFCFCSCGRCPLGDTGFIFLFFGISRHFSMSFTHVGFFARLVYWLLGQTDDSLRRAPPPWPNDWVVILSLLDRLLLCILRVASASSVCHCGTHLVVVFVVRFVCCGVGGGLGGLVVRFLLSIFN